MEEVYRAHKMENESGPIRFEREMDIPTCVHRLKVYLYLLPLPIAHQDIITVQRTVLMYGVVPLFMTLIFMKSDLRATGCIIGYFQFLDGPHEVLKTFLLSTLFTTLSIEK